ncbi:ADP-ribosylhydrolase ARH1-like isoform X1 [Hydra vulgaris]|nr:ADP-ribosylhydrolase ARH1 [Hydra vulgaris]
MDELEENYIASMVLAGVGDAIGYKCGKWEFCFDGVKIHDELSILGGIENLNVKKPGFIVSDDTVLLLSTAEALIEKSNSDIEMLYKELAFRYKHDFANDMKDRAGGITTSMACSNLKPNISKGWYVPFNKRGGGCGAAMRSMCIGLRYPNIYDVKCLEKLITISVESGRMTHNHPTGFLGSFAAALFGALSVVKYPLNKWGCLLIELLPKVFHYIESEGRDVNENKNSWSYFEHSWKSYLEKRNILNGKNMPLFPENFDVKERDIFYKSLSFSGWGGSSGHDAPMIAYDALLAGNGNWTKLCHHGMLHGGDNDSTGVIAGFCYGALFGFSGVPICNYNDVEYKDRLEYAGKKLYELAKNDGFLKFNTDEEIPISKLFKNNNLESKNSIVLK